MMNTESKANNEQKTNLFKGKYEHFLGGKAHVTLRRTLQSDVV